VIEPIQFEVLPDDVQEGAETIEAEEWFQDVIEGLDAYAAQMRGEEALRTTYVSTPQDGSYVSFYNPQQDELYIQVSQAAVASTEETTPGVMVDYDSNGRLVGMKLLQAAEHFAPLPMGMKAGQEAA
jgi:uncharacterized protein YuzE